MVATYKDMLAAAHAAVPRVTAAEAAGLVDKAGALIVNDPKVLAGLTKSGLDAAQLGCE